RMNLARALAALGLLLWLLGAHAAPADDGPQAPCGVAPSPGFSEPGAAPNVRSWSSGKLSRDWVAPACTGWTVPGFDVLVAVAGSFRHEGDVDELRARIGAISSLKAIRYWSTTDTAWRPLVTEAFALNGPDLDQKRPDFSAAHLAKGQTLYYAQSDNRSTGKTIYRQRVLEFDRERLVVGSENASAVKMMIMTLFGAGDLQSVVFLERRAPGVWAFYSLSRARAGSSMLGGGHEASYINRAVAFYRHVAGIPTDLEPPAAR
ncbi:MAG: DUF6675 family protein, partial [Rubrivivax sp.]